MEISNLFMGHLTTSRVHTLSIYVKGKGTEKTSGAVSETSHEKELQL